MPGFLLSAREHEMNFADPGDVSQERAQQDTVDVDELIFLKIILKNRYILIFGMLAGLIASLLVYGVLPKKYKAEAIILCKFEEIEDKSAQAILKALKGNKNMLMNFVSELVTSDKNVIYAELKKNGLLTPDNRKRLESHSLSSLISLSLVGDSFNSNSKNMLSIQASFTEDRKIPALLANYFAEQIINKIIDKIKNIFVVDIKTLNDALKLKQQQLEKLNHNIVQFIKRPDYIYNTVGENFLATDIYKIDEQLQKIIVQKNSLESEIGTLKKQLGIHVSLDKVKWISGDNILVKKISELKAQKNVLLGKYTEDNPKIIQLNYQIQSLEKLLNNDNELPDMKKIIVDMSKSQMFTKLALKFAKLKSINLEVESLKARRGNILKRLAEIPLQDSELKSLMKERNILKDSIRELLTTIDKKQTFITKLNTNFQVIKRAQIPDAPYSPRKLYVLVAGPAVMFIIILVAQLIRFSLSSTLINEIDIALKLKTRCIAIVTPFTEKHKDRMSRKVGRIMSKVVTGLKKGSLNNPIVLVTSPNKNDGKTFIASWLAITAAMLDYKTLYIKIPDPESRRVHTEKLGLINYFQSGSSIDEWSIIWKTKWDNLFYMPPGYGIDKNKMFETIDRNKVRDLLYFARAHFDLIVLDGGSLPSSMETTIFVHETDTALLVIASKRDKVEEVQEILDIVGKENVRIILNYVPKEIVQTVTIRARRAVNSLSSALRLMGVNGSIR